MSDVLYLVGATASGKKAIAAAIAPALTAELISLDSMKVYRGLERGTAKREAPALRLTDVVSAHEAFSAGAYVQVARRLVAEIAAAARQPLFVGGTGLYLHAMVRGLFEGPPVPAELRARIVARGAREGGGALHAELRAADPEAAARIHPHDLRRICRALEVFHATGEPISRWQRRATAPPLPGRAAIVGIRWPDAVLRQRIERRVARMLEDGLIEEVAALKEQRAIGPIALAGIGYAETASWLEEKSVDRAALAQRIARNTWRLSRKQANWFRRFPEIRWIEPAAEADAAALAERTLAAFAELRHRGGRPQPGAEGGADGDRQSFRLGSSQS